MVMVLYKENMKKEIIENEFNRYNEELRIFQINVDDSASWKRGYLEARIMSNILRIILKSLE